MRTKDLGAEVIASRANVKSAFTFIDPDFLLGQAITHFRKEILEEKIRNVVPVQSYGTLEIVLLDTLWAICSNAMSSISSGGAGYIPGTVTAYLVNTGQDYLRYSQMLDELAASQTTAKGAASAYNLSVLKLIPQLDLAGRLNLNSPRFDTNTLNLLSGYLFTSAMSSAQIAAFNAGIVAMKQSPHHIYLWNNTNTEAMFNFQALFQGRGFELNANAAADVIAKRNLIELCLPQLLGMVWTSDEETLAARFDWFALATAYHTYLSISNNPELYDSTFPARLFDSSDNTLLQSIMRAMNVIGAMFIKFGLTGVGTRTYLNNQVMKETYEMAIEHNIFYNATKFNPRHFEDLQQDMSSFLNTELISSGTEYGAFIFRTFKGWLNVEKLIHADLLGQQAPILSSAAGGTYSTFWRSFTDANTQEPGGTLFTAHPLPPFTDFRYDAVPSSVLRRDQINYDAFASQLMELLMPVMMRMVQTYSGMRNYLSRNISAQVIPNSSHVLTLSYAGSLGETRPLDTINFSNIGTMTTFPTLGAPYVNSPYGADFKQFVWANDVERVVIDINNVLTMQMQAAEVDFCFIDKLPLGRRYTMMGDFSNIAIPDCYARNTSVAPILWNLSNVVHCVLSNHDSTTPTGGKFKSAIDAVFRTMDLGQFAEDIANDLIGNFILWRRSNNVWVPIQPSFACIYGARTRDYMAMNANPAAADTLMSSDGNKRISLVRNFPAPARLNAYTFAARIDSPLGIHGEYVAHEVFATLFNSVLTAWDPAVHANAAAPLSGSVTALQQQRTLMDDFWNNSQYDTALRAPSMWSTPITFHPGLAVTPHFLFRENVVFTQPYACCPRNTTVNHAVYTNRWYFEKDSPGDVLAVFNYTPIRGEYITFEEANLIMEGAAPKPPIHFITASSMSPFSGISMKVADTGLSKSFDKSSHTSPDQTTVLPPSNPSQHSTGAAIDGNDTNRERAVTDIANTPVPSENLPLANPLNDFSGENLKSNHGADAEIADHSKSKEEPGLNKKD